MAIPIDADGVRGVTRISKPTEIASQLYIDPDDDVARLREDVLVEGAVGKIAALEICIDGEPVGIVDLVVPQFVGPGTPFYLSKRFQIVPRAGKQ